MNLLKRLKIYMVFRGYILQVTEGKLKSKSDI